ncbi:MAG TPA: ATP-binding protein [Thermoanaerobaculia bacterium]|nr:ATP-binding protein [Thermoanaerobaculia bacterium]
MTMSAKFRRDVAALGEVFELVEAFFSREALSARLRYPVDLAVEEVFTNFVKYNADAASDIGVSLRKEEGELVVSVTDFESVPFDLTKRVPPDISAPLGQRTPGGLGIHLVQNVMDRVEYEHRNRQSTVTLYKRLD